MVFAEAQAMGVPVVSTRHGGIPEVVFDRVTGLLAPERDHEALADSLCLLLGNEDLWRAFRSGRPATCGTAFRFEAADGLTGGCI